MIRKGFSAKDVQVMLWNNRMISIRSRREIPRFLILVLLQTACQNSFDVSGDLFRQKKAVIKSLNLLSARPKDEVIVTGTNLSNNLEVSVNDKPVVFRLTGSNSGTFVVPMDFGMGVQAVEFKLRGRIIAKFPLVNAASVESLPTLSISRKDVCDTYIFKTPEGELVKGASRCGYPTVDCVKDGQTDCKASEKFPAIAKSKFPGNTQGGQITSGVSGTAASEPSQCIE